MALLLTSLLIASAVSAMPLNTDPSTTAAPVMPQFTFTPIPVNEPASTASPIGSSSSDAILTKDEAATSNPTERQADVGPETATLIEQPVPVPVLNNDASIAVQPVIDASTTQPEHVTATQIVEASSASLQQNDASIAVEPVAEASTIVPQQSVVTESAVESSSVVNQNDAVAVESHAIDSTTTQTMTASERAAEPVVLLDEPAQVQVEQVMNAENVETVTETSTAEVVTFEPVTATSEVSVQNDATMETAKQTEVVGETTTSTILDEATSTQMPGDQPQLDFVDETVVENTAYQYLNMADSSADNLIINITMPSSPTELISRLQQSTHKLNYSEKLDLALQLTALAHTLMTSVDNQLDVLKD